LASNFTASLILDLRASLNLARLESTSKFKLALKFGLNCKQDKNLTVKIERKFEVIVKCGFTNGFKFDEAAAKFKQ